METMLIQLTDLKAIGLIKELEQLNLIKVLSKNENTEPPLSAKYKGIITKEQGKQLNSHIKKIRGEWNGI